MDELNTDTQNFCWYCEHGITIPGFPYECRCPEAQREYSLDGFCPEDYTCPYFLSSSIEKQDQRQFWRKARLIKVD